ncbi:Retrovirus-related Pol poly from transposon TNT 1-94 [Paramuricea clavata]|uniref:Retrovirus-related Pol poly from transposon TNT 1-94 n=1 Tax=Paramuricea clavata TaxID=317549 RepID=A0A6S7GJK5_PARCT|nr:Retrovirus-related Pol poly from transposon TNT 1-94 [Paramuricea clavata]
MASSTGYGPRAKILFNGDERKYELWETKFMGYLHILKLKETVESAEPNEAKNADVYAELIQVLDDRSLSLVMRDAKDDGKKAISILREHYMSSGKPKIIALYTELTTLNKGEAESVTDYMLRAEAATAALKNAGEEVGDALLIAMILKGLPLEFKAFNTVITQKDKQPSYTEFKVALRAFEENEKPMEKNNVMKTGFYTKMKCFACKQYGHKADQCTRSKKWCSHCKTRTHNTKDCRRKNQNQDKKEDERSQAAKSVQDQEARRSFAFIVSDAPAENDVDYLKASLLVDCGATTHIVNDKSKFTSFDESFNPEVHFIELADGTRYNNIALKRGDANVLLEDKLGNQHSVTLQNALYVPSFSQDIFSVQAASENGASISFQPGGQAFLSAGDGTQFDIQKRGRLYYLYSIKSAAHDLQTWHEILGHCNVKDTLQLQHVVDGMSINNKKKVSDCEVCILGKMTNIRNRDPDAKGKVPLELVHADLAGPVIPESSEGFKYVLAYTDDYSGATFTYLLKRKSDTLSATEKFLADSSPYGKIKCIRSDNGTEFTNNAYKSLLVRNKIKHETSAPYSPHQNGTAERNWRTLFEMARCLLIDAKLEKKFWPYAVLTATYIRNRYYNNRNKQTPYQALTNKKPNLSNMAIFGTECFAYTQNKTKLDARCEKGIFLGYDKSSPAYLVLFPENGKIQKIRNVKFTNKFKIIEQDNDIQTNDDILHREIRLGAEMALPQVRPEGGKFPLQPDNVEAGLLEAENHEPAPQPRYPVRNTRRPPHLNDYIVENDLDDDDVINHNVDYCCATSVYPKSYKEAIKSKDSEKWCEAMNEEISSLSENNTYTLTKLPEGKSIVGARWVYTVKEGKNGEKSYKARYVAKGYSQVPEVDYFETFSPTAKITSIRMLMQLALDLDMEVHQMDVKTAYLNAPVDCELYIEQPEGFVKHSESGEMLVCKLNKSLYGLKQSGRNWNHMLHTFLTSKGFTQLVSDPCVYIKKQNGKTTILLIWVDDIIIASNSTPSLKQVKDDLSCKFKMKDLGILSWFLGINFTFTGNTITMDQIRYIERILIRFKMEG